MQPLSQIAGAAGAATGFIQMITGALASRLVGALYDGHSTLSMNAVMALCSFLALSFYLLLARPAERVVVLVVDDAPLDQRDVSALPRPACAGRRYRPRRRGRR